MSGENEYERKIMLDKEKKKKQCEFSCKNSPSAKGTLPCTDYSTVEGSIETFSLKQGRSLQK